jgi:hypothetical protein
MCCVCARAQYVSDFIKLVLMPVPFAQTLVVKKLAFVCGVMILSKYINAYQKVRCLRLRYFQLYKD